MSRGLSAMHLQGLASKDRERSGPGLKAAQAVEETACCSSEVHAAVFFFQNRRERGARIILSSRTNFPILESAESLYHQICADRRQLRAQCLGGVFRGDRNLMLHEYVAGVEPGVNAHGGNS